MLLVHHHSIVRHGLRSILDREADLQLTGEAESGLAAVELVRRTLPDVAIVDLQLTAPSGLETAKAIWAVYPEVRVIFVSLITTREYVEEIARSGAHGFVVYEKAQTDLVHSIRAAWNRADGTDY